jgi:hypothetical protein
MRHAGRVLFPIMGLVSTSFLFPRWEQRIHNGWWCFSPLHYLKENRCKKRKDATLPRIANLAVNPEVVPWIKSRPKKSFGSKKIYPNQTQRIWHMQISVQIGLSR